MRAVRQGDLDALCGVYAIINALEVAGVTGPRSQMHRRLFRRLTCGLPPDRLQNAMHDGLDQDDLIKTSNRAFRWLRQAYGLRASLSQPLRGEEIDDLAVYVATVAEWTREPNLAVIVNVHLAGLSHWTVVRTVKGRAMEVRDSTTLKRLALDRFSLVRGRYRFSAPETLLLRVGGVRPLAKPS